MKMKKVSTFLLESGMVVAEDVLALDRRLILEKGTTLTPTLIDRLQEHSILEIYIVDAPPAEAKEPSYADRVRQSQEFKEFKADYDINISSFKHAVNNVVEKNMTLDISALLADSLDLATSNRGNIHVLDMLHNMRDYDDSTFTHCMNVALICNVLTRWLKWSDADIELATACGLFHDIGKLMVPQQIITKPAKLTNEEYNEVQKHTISGFHILQKQNVDIHIQRSALMHHERSDGTGYPMHLAGEQIDRFARVVAIADVYDAMTASRCYRGALCPFRVIELFEEEGFQRYDVSYLIPFLENVVNTYLKNRCRLSDGREAEIIFINKDKLSRPMVQCDGEYLSLADYPNLTISCLL